MDDTVASIDGTVFSRHDFFGELTPSSFAKLDSSARRELVEQFVINKILVLEAERRKIDRDSKVRMQIETSRSNLLVDQIIDEEVWTLILSDSSLRLLYQRLGRKVEVSTIFIRHNVGGKSEAHRTEQEALGLMKTIKLKVASGKLPFKVAAQRYSEGPLAPRGGYMGFVTWGRLFEPLQSVAFSLTSMQLSDPIRSELGYHLVWVGAIKPIPLSPFEEELAKLKQFIRTGKGQEFQTALRRFELRLSDMTRLHFNGDMVGVLLREIVRVHEDLEELPKAGELAHVDVNGIVCTVDGEPYDVRWFKERMTYSPTELATSVIDSKRTLRTVLEHMVYRFLTERYAVETRPPEWHREVERRVKAERIKILRNVILEKLSDEHPELSEQEMIQSLVDRHRIRVNDEFVSSY